MQYYNWWFVCCAKVPYDAVIQNKIQSDPNYFVQWNHQAGSTAGTRATSVHCVHAAHAARLFWGFRYNCNCWCTWRTTICHSSSRPVTFLDVEHAVCPDDGAQYTSDLSRTHTHTLSLSLAHSPPHPPPPLTLSAKLATAPSAIITSPRALMTLGG